MFTILHNYRNDFLILLLLLSGAISCYWLFYEPVEKRATIATIKPSEMEHCGDNCWQWKKKRESIDALSSIPSDYKGSYSKSSKLLLLEDGTPLRLPHSSKQDIQHKGKGRYRHYCNSLSFSTSDNTDPRSNGRTYEIGIPKRKLVLPYFGIFFTAVFVVCLSMLLRRYMPKISRPRCCNISTICFFDRLDNPQGSYPPPSRPSSKDLSESTLIMICSFVLFATFLLVLFNSTSIQARFPWMSVSKLSRTIFVVLIALGSIVVFVMHRYSKRQNRGNAPKQDDKDAAARQKIIFQNIYDAFVSTAARRVFFRIVLYTSALFLAFLPLINNWISAPSGRHRFVVWGALPNSDSKYYYLGALKLLIMGVLPYGRSALRPMNTSALAFDLGLFGLNIQYATAFRAFIVAIACILAARALAKTYNCLVGIIAYLTFLQFSEMLTPSLMSEPNAMIFGVLSFYFVWRGIEEKRDNLFYLGAFLLSMSLLIRTGAMFVIPCMIIAAGFIFQRKDGRTPAPWPMLRTSAAVILAISMNWLCGELYRPDDYVTNNENFNMVLYNIANGSGGWKVPANETAQLNEVLNITGQSAHRRFLKEEAYKKMVARPEQSLIGLQIYASNFLRDVVWKRWICALPFSKNNSMWPIAVNITLLILGLAFIVGKKRRKTMLLLGAFWSGVALSAPFVGSVGGDRIWLCLAPYVVLPFLIGLFVVSESVLISIRPKKPVAQDFIAEKAALALAIFIVLRTVFGPLLMQWHYRDKYPTLAASTSCERIFWNADYIPVRFSSNTARPVSFSPFLKSSRFKKIDESKDVYVFYPFGGRNPARIGYMKQDDAPEHTGWHYLEQDPEKKNFYRRCKPEETKHGLIE